MSMILKANEEDLKGKFNLNSIEASNSFRIHKSLEIFDLVI